MKISSDGNQVNVAIKKEREQQSVDLECSRFSPRRPWRCCPELVQIHRFRSIEVLLDTPPRSPKNYPKAKGGSVQVEISSVQSSQVVPWVLAMSSPINQLLLA
ncbi:hypothetical protein DY000_02000187 [Brassica cretica]|uniref:Uncharacterized protein n=1 Tax=Brassica cretica TaxID=69181 RepID=A0ABQ7CHN0_BRACR|nr:hypothetical protein DY000_02000187 [Brassica cretica]